MIGRPIDQAELDGFLADKTVDAGRNTCCALSSAYHDAVERSLAVRGVRLVPKAYKGSTVLVVSHGIFLQMCHGVLPGSHCIESLGTYPGTLEVRRFDLAGRRLVSEEVTGLSGASGKTF